MATAARSEYTGSYLLIGLPYWGCHTANRCYICDSFIQTAVRLTTAHSHFHCTQCDIVLLLSIYSVSAFLKVIHQLRTPSSSSSLYFFYHSFNNVFQKAVPTPAVTNPVSLPTIYCLYDISLLLDCK